jgi:hypothetical protein
MLLIRRNKKGAAIAEVGPALFLLLLMCVFPLLDLIFAGCAYSGCMLLNDLELREACRVPSSACDTELTAITMNFCNSGIARFIGIEGQPTFQVNYEDDAQSQGGAAVNNVYVTVATTLIIHPFLTIPFFNSVPALGAPVTYTIVGRKILENPGYAIH